MNIVKNISTPTGNILIFRMEKAHNHGCASIDGKLCYYAPEKNKCPHVNQYLVCINKDIVFIADTIIPQKLALYEEIISDMRCWHDNVPPALSPNLAYLYKRFEEIIDSAKKIEEAT